MTRKGKGTEIISVSLPEGTAREVDRMVAEGGYPSRSELVREAIRGLIKANQRMSDLEGEVDGVMILLYDHKASREVGDIRHASMGLIKSFMHTDFADHSCSVHEDTSKCCEVLLFSGDAVDVRRVHDALRAVKHLEESLVFLA